MDGLDTISDILCQSAVVDELYRNTPTQTTAALNLKRHFKAKRIDLYAKIIDYMVKIYCDLSGNPLVKYASDLVKWNDWATLLLTIENVATLTREDRGLLHEQKLADGFEQQKADIRNVLQALKGIHEKIQDLDEKQEKHHLSSIHVEILETLRNKLEYEKFKEERNPVKAPGKRSCANFPITRALLIIKGTGKWLLEDPKFKEWNESKKSELLLLSAGPGCGKSVLARSLINYDLLTPSYPHRTISYFFFKDDNNAQNNAKNALCAILHQLLSRRTSLIQYVRFT
jgi:hypothetical protein